MIKKKNYFFCINPSLEYLNATLSVVKHAGSTQFNLMITTHTYGAETNKIHRFIMLKNYEIYTKLKFKLKNVF